MMYGELVQTWAYYQEEIRQTEPKEIVRIGSQVQPGDSVAVRWVELQRFYMMLMSGKVIARSRLVGIPFRDLLRTRFAYLVLAAKEEMSSGLGYTT